MRLRRRRRARDNDSTAAEMPKPKPEVRTVLEPVAEEAAPEAEEVEGRPQVVGPGPRRSSRELPSMETRRKQEGSGDDSGEAGQSVPRLIVKERGGEIAPEPRRSIREAGEDTANAEKRAQDQAVLRLEKEASRPRRTHDVAVEVVVTKRPKEEDEDTWTEESKGVSWRWAMVVASGMVVLVIAALVVVQVLTVWRSEEGIRVSPVVDFEVERIDIGEARVLLEADPTELFEEAQQILEGYATASEVGDALTWVRGGDLDREVLASVWQPWTSPPYFERPELVQYGVMSFQDPPALVMWGLRKDFSPFRAYFVSEGGQLRLDWRATEGYSDIPISELAAAEDVKGVTVRSMVQEKPFHTASLPDDRFRSFMLSAVDGLNFVWGYVELGSDLAHQLENMLNRGTGVQETKSRGRATLVVDRPEVRDLSNQFLITEVLHNEWVGP